MTTPVHDLEREMATSHLSVVFDLFANAAAVLGGQYVQAWDQASSDAERTLWKAKAAALRQYQADVDPTDRAQIIRAIVLLRAERAVLAASPTAA